MVVADKKAMSEQNIRTKYITPAIYHAGWNLATQIREEVDITKGQVLVRGAKTSRGKRKYADYVLYHKPNLPLAVIEAKDNNHQIGDGMQQALEYAAMLDVPFAFSSNGDGFLMHDRTLTSSKMERELRLDEFPSPSYLWDRYCAWKGIDAEISSIIDQDYYIGDQGKVPRYYQIAAINRTVEAIAKRQNRILLVMATGTGKTYTAFQIIWRLWKSGVKKRILFLADRNILIDQAKTNDFKPFGSAMTKITNRSVDKSYEIYLALYQAVTGSEDWKNIYRQFSPDFFDLIVVDECHRGSAAEDSEWRGVLEYFSSATQIGMTALDKVQKGYPTTPEERKLLREKKLIEGRHPHIFVSASVAAETDTRADYIKKRSFDKEHFKDMVVSYLKEFHQADRGEIDTLLLNKVSDALTYEQKRLFVKNLLQEMRKEGTIETAGSKTYKAKWILTETGGGKQS